MTERDAPDRETTERIATYRWQLTPTEDFDAAAAAVPDLATLGISHLYLSPIAEAVPGSTHGYDVTDPTRIRAELGGPEGFERLVGACRAAGLRLLVDIVPNHLAAHHTNPWWWDVLRRGRASPYADVFDIDWTPADTVLLPVLGDHYGRELEGGTLRVEPGAHPGQTLVVAHHDRIFPLRPDDEEAILAYAAGRGSLDEALAALNADVERLDLLLERQHYRLARWTVGDAELDYRRFFDVDGLVATRMERPATFELVHQLVRQLVASDVVDGVRVDHVDGLADPAGYLATLREVVGPDAWVLVEKILRRDEALPAWPVAGTTGYEVMDLLGGWLGDPVGSEVIRRTWIQLTGQDRGYHEVAEEARREVLSAGFASDLERVVDAVHEVCQRRRRHRDHARAALRTAVAELAVHMTVYRTYVVPSADGPPANETDRAVIATAVARARAAPEIDPELLELLADILTGRHRGDAEALVVQRFQQLTGPIAAKGEEDTALYRWLPLPHRGEVGADPSLAVTTAAEWHGACVEAQERWPQRLTALSTHDTKRSADARARLAALTAVPDTLTAAYNAWCRATGADGIDAGTSWLVFHVLVAGWPMETGRAWTLVAKSVREAGLRTSWVRPEHSFEADLRALVGRAADDATARSVVDDLVHTTADAADAAALAQLLAQLLAPGVPDVYQGGEGWDRSLVDPDNRRPPDPSRRAELIAAAVTADATATWDDATLRASGLPRTLVLRGALDARRRHPQAVGPGLRGAYGALEVAGPDADRVLAFTRGAPPELAVVVARPGPDGGQPTADTTVTLPEGRWTDLFTGAAADGVVPVRELLREFPVALLER